MTHLILMAVTFAYNKLAGTIIFIRRVRANGLYINSIQLRENPHIESQVLELSITPLRKLSCIVKNIASHRTGRAPQLRRYWLKTMLNCDIVHGGYVE
ncbi:hypothetical protein H4582DRAFT_1937123 [Lactarius indigo]|nr:hypothetical protein H4582DRAFT_1937123 [Lactarius indigo]